MRIDKKWVTQSVAAASAEVVSRALLITSDRPHSIPASILFCLVKSDFPFSLSLSTRRPHFNDFTLSSPRLIAICLFLLFRIGREQNIKKFQRISEVRAILSRPQGPGGV